MLVWLFYKELNKPPFEYFNNYFLISKYLTQYFFVQSLYWQLMEHFANEHEK